MPRPAKPPRLILRSGTWYLIDTANGIRVSLRTADTEVAARRLKEYTMNLGSYAPPQEPLVKDVLEAYRLSRLDVLKNRGRARARKIAERSGMTPDEAEAAAQQSVEAVVDAGTLEFSIAALNRHLGDLRLKALSSEVARRYRDCRRAEGKRNRSQRGTVADGTIRRELSVLKAALSWAYREASEIWFGPKRQKPEFDYPVAQAETRQEFLDHADVTKLIVNCTEPHLRLYILLAVQSGARKSAILSLRWDDVDFKRRIIDYGIADTRKRKPIVKMTSALYNAMILAFACRTVSSTHVIEYRSRPIDKHQEGLPRPRGEVRLRPQADHPSHPQAHLHLMAVPERHARRRHRRLRQYHRENHPDPLPACAARSQRPGRAGGRPRFRAGGPRAQRGSDHHHQHTHRPRPPSTDTGGIGREGTGDLQHGQGSQEATRQLKNRLTGGNHYVWQNDRDPGQGDGSSYGGQRPVESTGHPPDPAANRADIQRGSERTRARGSRHGGALLPRICQHPSSACPSATLPTAKGMG